MICNLATIRLSRIRLGNAQGTSGRIILTWVALLLLVMARPIDAEDGLRAGAATSNITPDIGGEIIGGFVPFPSTHIHDDLHVRCLVLDDGKTRLALVACDLLGIDRAISEAARENIFQRHGIPKSHVLISATHTHSATSALGMDSRVLDQPLDDYQRFVIRRITDGVTRAIHHLEPAELAFGTVDAPEHVFNRRWHMLPGTAPVNPFGEIDAVKMNPPRASPNLVRPAGPVDPEVSFLIVRRPDASPIALYAAYSLHYVGGVRKGDVSADYFAVFCDTLNRQLGNNTRPAHPPFVAMLANGTSGDINNINFQESSRRKPAYEQMRFVGQDVANKVIGVLDSLTYQSHPTLDARYREPRIRWRKVPEETLRWAKETLANGPRSERDLSYLYAQRTLRQAEYPEFTHVPIQALRIGDVCIGTMPFEVFAETGLAFKQRCPFPNAFLVELAHGYFGYLPTPRHFRLGGYETWIGTNRVEPNASEILLDQLLEMANELRAGDHSSPQ